MEMSTRVTLCYLKMIWKLLMVLVVKLLVRLRMKSVFDKVLSRTFSPSAISLLASQHALDSMPIKYLLEIKHKK